MLIKILIFCCILVHGKAHDCDKRLSILADRQGRFLRCVTINSVPVTMCIGCKEIYEDMLHLYDELVQICNATYFDKDRMNLVPSTEALLNGIWTKAYCDDCFNNNNSITFDDKNASFYSCLASNHNKPCDKCQIAYMGLNDFYLSLDKHNNGEVCFDIQDSMNRTRYKWSKELQCCLREYNILYFSITLVIVACTTLMFYSCAYFLTKRHERNHGMLNDEDPLFNSPSLAPAGHLNITNNQTQINSLFSVNEGNSIPSSTSQTFEDNKVSKTDTPSEDSSDDEPLVKNKNPSVVKEKLK